LEELKKANYSLLICSDSVNFLKIVSKIPGVFIIPGELTHMQYTKLNDFGLNLKSFLDFFMISESESVRSVGTNIMYQSDFPALAASIKNVHFERVELN